jgi:hypothetical protein
MVLKLLKDYTWNGLLSNRRAVRGQAAILSAPTESEQFGRTANQNRNFVCSFANPRHSKAMLHFTTMQ